MDDEGKPFGSHAEDYARIWINTQSWGYHWQWGERKEYSGHGFRRYLLPGKLLGIRPTARGLVIDPAIPGDWKGYDVTRIYRGCKLAIHVENPDGVQHGVKCIRVDGKEICGNIITPDMVHDNESADIIVILG